MRFKFVLASGIHARRCGGVRQLIGRCEGGERGVREKRDSRGARCTHTVGGREQTDLANIFKNKFQGKEKKRKGLQN